MANKILKYARVLRYAYKNYTIYIYDLIGKNIIFSFRIIIIILLYQVIYASNGGQHVQLFGYHISELIWALIFTQLIVVSQPRFVNSINDEIKTGKICHYFLNPIPYVTFKFMENMSISIYNLILMLIPSLLIGRFFIGSINFDLAGILSGTILIIGALLINFFCFMIIGLLGFYVEEISPIRWIYSKFSMILGGNILPLPFLPVWIQNIAYYSPFPYLGYTTGLIIVNFESIKFLQYFLIQTIWIIILIIITKLLFGHAQKKLVINGG